MSEGSEEFRRGLIEGRMTALEERHAKTEGRVDGLDGRVTAQERITYALLGALAFLQLLPVLESLVK